MDGAVATAEVQQQCLNKLPAGTGDPISFAGIIGDRPSRFAKSPSIWNPVFQKLGMDATYVAFDVEPGSLGGLVGALRRHTRYLGGNVTMPYKVAVMEHLDEVEAMARETGAVNTIVRTSDGRLVGYNTDGRGAVDALSKSLPGAGAPLISELDGKDVLLIGAGGAARAIAFAMAEAIGSGTLTIANRDVAKARQIAERADRHCGEAIAIGESDIAAAAAASAVVINASTKGQSGRRPAGAGRSTMLEPFSALAPAQAISIADEGMDDLEFSKTWFAEALPAIEQNNAESARTALKLKQGVPCFDAVYSPLETVFLRHSRLAGHATANGKAMNIYQAAHAFFNIVGRDMLEAAGRRDEATLNRIVGTMSEVW